MARKTSKPPCLPDKPDHYWQIETANGPQSFGVCKYCGLEGYHDNYIESGPYTRHDELKKEPDLRHNNVT